MLMSNAYQDEFLTNSWTRCFSELTNGKDLLLRDLIIWKYSDPRRHYHNISHLIGCIQICRTVVKKLVATMPFELELALWIHDIENKPNYLYNEEDSIQFFLLEANGIAKERFHEKILHKLSEAVLATKHTLNEDQGLEIQKYICDIDLVTLGSDTKTFNNYCDKIRKEHSFISNIVYYTERIKVLQSFLDRGFIYRTSHFKELYEAYAINNVSIEIQRIKNLL